jgi:methyl-accepting chemotaxis protein
MTATPNTPTEQPHTNAALRGLCLSLLPLWERHLQTAQHQSEQAIADLLQLFAQLQPHLGAANSAVVEGAPPLQALLEDILTGFQYQDRVAQMVRLLQDDMDRLRQLLQDPHTEAEALDAQAWLTRLESQYAMEEQRHNHHGSDGSIPRPPGDEMTFF